MATIDRTGHLVALKAGSTTITASIQHQQASVAATVTEVSAVSFPVQPSNTPVSATIWPPVQILVLDNLHHALRGLSVTISLGANPPQPVVEEHPAAPAVLAGRLTQTTDATGTVTFPDLSLDYLGTGYSLVATVATPTGPFPSTSGSFNATRVGDPYLGPVPSPTCPDADGDGLHDAWEIAGGIDYNGDGKIDDGGTSNGEHRVAYSGAGPNDLGYDLLLPGADPHKPDIYSQYDWMDYSLDGHTCNLNADCTLLGTGHAGETCTGPAITGKGAHSCVFACTTDDQCALRGPSHIGEQCVANSCLHTHDPEVLRAGTIQAVVESFAARGFNLHVLRGRALPHSLVLSFRQNIDLNAFCEGGSLAGGSVGPGRYAESFYDLKSLGFDARQKPAYHYGIFGHYSSCDSRGHCPACEVPLNPNGSPKSSPPQFGSSGVAEINGNDLIVSLASVYNDRNARPTLNNLGGTLMHELGHNLGLRHGGGSDFDGSAEDTPNFKPNYLSVMNYNRQFVGIQRAEAIGSIIPQRCSSDVDCLAGEHCGGACTRLDYSTQTLPTGGNTPGAFDESNLNEPAGLGSGTADLTYFDDGACDFGYQPTQGPLDFDGDGDFTGTHVSADLIRADHPAVMICPTGVIELLNGHTDWGPAPGQSIFNYKFQFTPMYADGAPPPRRPSRKMS